MDKYQNKYRIPSARLQNWDYGANGAYFITICTQDRAHFFGEICNGIMCLNEIGVVAHKYWAEIPRHFPFAALGNFIIMPNHMHGILIIDNFNDTEESVETLQCGIETLQPGMETLQCNVSTNNQNITTDAGKNEQMRKISPRPGSVSTIIRSYKSVVSKKAHLIHADFGWQPRFHDHVIRNAKSFEIIQNYIANNPSNWEKDKFYN